MEDNYLLPGDGLYDMFKDYGFEAGETVYLIAPSFTVAELRDAHYSNTYADPLPLRIEVDRDIVFDVVVQTGTSVFVGFDHSGHDAPLGCYKFSDRSVEGWLLKSGFDPFSEVVRVRMYLKAGADGTLGEGFIQRIPKNRDPNGPIRYIETP